MHALRLSGDVKLEVGERAELRGDVAGECVCVLGGNLSVSMDSFRVDAVGCFWRSVSEWVRLGDWTSTMTVRGC
jgi:hypothetical protein